MIQMTQEQFKGYGAENISEIAAFARPYLEHRIDLYKKYARKLNENQFMGEAMPGRSLLPLNTISSIWFKGILAGNLLCILFQGLQIIRFLKMKEESFKKHQIRSEKPLPGRSQDIVMSKKSICGFVFGSN